MSGDNGRGVLLGQDRFPAEERVSGLPGEQAEELVASLVDRLVQRVEKVVQEQVGRVVLPRLEEIENNVEDLKKQVRETGRPTQVLPVEPAVGQQELQQQALARVD
jgi:hypothetical protein